jgi:D-serine deaminase-like pyridoxal phosphate-dependent protein
MKESMRSEILSSKGFGRNPPELATTPFIELDRGRLVRNITAMQTRAAAAGVNLRPHIKTHKSIELARLQLNTGAVGVTASKPTEALVFVEACVPSVTIAYPVIHPDRLDSLLRAAKDRDVEVQFIAGDETGVAVLETAASRHGMVLPVFMKVDVGLGRVGVNPYGDDALVLAHAIRSRKSLRFLGLLSHAGHAYGASDLSEIRQIAKQEAADLNALKQRLSTRGIQVQRISVGATPTCLGAPLPQDVDEIRPGNYVFLDATALRLGICSPDDLAMSVIASVVSRNGRYAIIDAGTKAMSSDLGPHGTGGSGFGIVTRADTEDARVWSIEKMSEEHGFVSCDRADLPVGTRLRIFPNHSCAVVALFDRYGPASGACDTQKAAIDARGCLC